MSCRKDKRRGRVLVVLPKANNPNLCDGLMMDVVSIKKNDKTSPRVSVNVQIFSCNHSKNTSGRSVRVRG